MRILIHGNDSFRIIQTYKEIVDQFKKKHDPEGKNIYKFDSKDDFRPIFNLVQQDSLFAKKQLIIIDDCQNFKAVDLEKVCELNKRINSVSTVLYRCHKELATKNKLDQELLASEKVYLQNQLVASELKKWISDLAKQNNLKLDNNSIDMIVNATNDGWVINNLISQLTAHTKASNTNDTETLIRLLTVSKDETPIFALTEALAGGNSKQAINLLNHHLKDGAEPLMILGLLAKHIRDLINAKYNIKSNFKSEYIFNKLNQISRKFSDKQLSNWQQSVILTDIAIKRGQPPLMCITNLVLNMANFRK